MENLNKYLKLIKKISIVLILIIHPLNGQNNDSAKSKLIKVNFDIGLIANNGFSNLYSNYLIYNPPNSKYIYYYSNYSKKNANPICYGLSLGTDMVVGNNKILKQIFTLNYDITNSEYKFYSTYQNLVPNNSFYEIKNFEIKKSAHFVVLGYGVLIQFPYNLNLTTIGCVNFNVYNSEKQTGSILRAYNSVIYDDTLYVNGLKVKNKTDTTFLSIRFKIAKDFVIRTKKIGVFIQHNISLSVYHKNKYIAPWWILGLQFDLFNNTKHLKNN